MIAAARLADGLKEEATGGFTVDSAEFGSARIICSPSEDRWAGAS